MDNTEEEYRQALDVIDPAASPDLTAALVTAIIACLQAICSRHGWGVHAYPDAALYQRNGLE